MKALLTALLLMLAAGTAFAQAGSIGVFEDTAGLNCNLSDVPVGLHLYYVVHINTTGATKVEYRARLPLCMTQLGAMWLQDTNPFPMTAGNSQVGVTVTYGDCRVGPIRVQTINVFVLGTTPPCCRWYVDANPNNASGMIQGTDCNFAVMYPTGLYSVVNGNETCPCGSEPPPPFPGVDVGCPPDTTISEGSTIPSISRAGFRVTNEGNIPLAFEYSVAAEGPCALADNGDPASLSGTTPILAPGASYYPPPLALLVPELRVYAKEYVTYQAQVEGNPDVAASCRTVIKFYPPVPTKQATWGRIKALYE
jgi:hypothetical protein